MHTKTKKGVILINTIVFASISMIMVMALIGWVAVVLKNIRNISAKEQALQIAEAGVDYYRWHLAHDPDDFQDGTGVVGPYVHAFNNKDDVRIGQFSLDITPPPTGSTLVTIRSTGLVDAYPTLTRTIISQLAIPSFAKYAVVANDVMRFGEGTEVFGPIHANGGIRFDGLAHNIVTSAVEEYKDPDHSGNDEFGVHTHLTPIDPVPPNPVPLRPDVFEIGREFPVASVDFVGITSDLSNMKALAQADGHYFASSGAQGYLIVLKTNDTFDLYRVNSLVPVPNGCTQVIGQQGWGTRSILTQTLIGTYNNPNNGIVFVEDHVWVQGQINTARITIAAGRFPDNPAQRKDIIINNDLLYTNYDGQDVIGLIAQGSVTVGLVSETDLRIDAALIAQNGRVGRHYYQPPSGNQTRCSPYHVRNVITLYGMIGTYERYGFAYTDGTGYLIRNINYDANLLYSPPPHFPLTSDQYQVVSWEEER